MDIAQLLADFGDWAFDRHANPLSWYVRPLFLLPSARSAYRLSGWGITGILVALAASASWSPAPSWPGAAEVSTVPERSPRRGARESSCEA